MLIDTHCHLDFPDFAEDFTEILLRAKAADVSKIITISTLLSEYEKIKAIADTNAEIYWALAQHPCNVQNSKDIRLEDLLYHKEDKKLVALGETGLDYYHDTTYINEQKLSFATHIEAGRQMQLPIMIHSRAADLDMADMLKSEMVNGDFNFILHSFTSSKQLAKAALDLGGYISLSGIITFKNANELREVVRYLPVDRLLVETDGPYLAPVPKRGQRNEPAFVRYTAEYLAEFLNIDYINFAKQLQDNSLRVLPKLKNIAE